MRSGKQFVRAGLVMAPLAWLMSLVRFKV